MRKLTGEKLTLAQTGKKSYALTCPDNREVICYIPESNRYGALGWVTFNWKDVILEKGDCWDLLKQKISLALFNLTWRKYIKASRAGETIPKAPDEFLAYLHRLARDEVTRPESIHRLYSLKEGLTL